MLTQPHPSSQSERFLVKRTWACKFSAKILLYTCRLRTLLKAAINCIVHLLRIKKWNLNRVIDLAVVANSIVANILVLRRRWCFSVRHCVGSGAAWPWSISPTVSISICWAGSISVSINCRWATSSWFCSDWEVGWALERCRYNGSRSCRDFTVWIVGSICATIFSWKKKKSYLRKNIEM